MIWMMHLRSIRTEGVDSGEERAQCSGGGGQRSAIRCRPSRPVAVTAASGPCPAMAAAVLRVKRKRGAEAAEALLLACKRPRTDGEPAPQQQVVRTLFRIAATVGSQDDTLQQHVKEAIFKEKALLALKPSSASAQRAHVNVRASRQAARQEGRYKVIASHRRNCLKSLNDENIDQKSDSNTSEAQEEGGCQKINGTASTSGKDGIGSAEEIEVFDVVHHEEDKGDSKHKHCTTKICHQQKLPSAPDCQRKRSKRGSPPESLNVQCFVSSAPAAFSLNHQQPKLQMQSGSLGTLSHLGSDSWYRFSQSRDRFQQEVT
ncbi:probable RNA polymerase II nuclear localization protein SLC7A6OS isoform X4 [Narcine bancroftii]|uniref:probable RNA polymerase II nuclear localization protein SLC7A6OS isoform X4 n=1 Tax=Narcine bancroftii TaxID=1343680 RepID=UPI0038317E7B